jgi:hypothetical protein
VTVEAFLVKHGFKVPGSASPSSRGASRSPSPRKRRRLDENQGGHALPSATSWPSRYVASCQLASPFSSPSRARPRVKKSCGRIPKLGRHTGWTWLLATHTPPTAREYRSKSRGSRRLVRHSVARVERSTTYPDVLRALNRREGMRPSGYRGRCRYSLIASPMLIHADPVSSRTRHTRF